MNVLAACITVIQELRVPIRLGHFHASAMWAILARESHAGIKMNAFLRHIIAMLMPAASMAMVHLLVSVTLATTALG
jgi:hypothetical protein